MQLVFGWDLDGDAYPETVDGTAALGAAVVGPAGLVDVLERWLGLGAPAAAQALRIAQYLSRLREGGAADAFFAGSLAVDGWATARELLGWRDALVAGGWRGEPVTDGGARLQVLATLERHVRPLAPGSGDRLRAVREALLNERRRPPIAALRVVTPCHLLPPPWPALLDRLAALGVTVDGPPAERAVGAGDLAALQARLLGDRGAALVGDERVALLEADDPLQAAELTASWFATSADADAGLVLIRGEGSVLLDEAFHRLGLPRPGCAGRSALRGPLQLLPLAFELAWQPFDPQRALELLLLPGSPVPPRVARCFAEALREAPGIGGPAWQAAREAALERWAAKLGQEGLVGAELQRRLQADEAGWRDWLEASRFDPGTGMPAVEADRICRRVQGVMQRRAAATDDPLYGFGMAAATALAEAIQNAGLGWLTRPQLARMIDSVLDQGAATASRAGEASPWAVVGGPGQIWRHAATVIWWDFVDPGTALPPDPWSTAERTALQAAGIGLDDRRSALARLTRSWRSAVLNAEERLLLVRPRRLAGKPTLAHPLWHELAAGRRADELARVTVDGAQALRQSRFGLLGNRDRRVALESLALPAVRADWSVAADRIPPLQRHSASSIERLLGCRLAWTLHSAARIRSGGLIVLPNDNLLIGNLAHAIAAELFRDRERLEATDVAEQATSLFDRLLPLMAAPLLQPGQETVRHRARAGIAAGLTTLVELLNEAELRVEGCEIERRVPDGDGELMGRLDMVCRAPDGSRVVVDLKWSTGSSRREAELAEGRSVQLALYAHLESAASRATASSGFYMLRQRRLLHLGDGALPGRAVDGPGLREVWQKVDTARRQAFAAVRAGHVVAEGDALHELIDLESPALPGLVATCAFCDYRQLCGVGRPN